MLGMGLLPARPPGATVVEIESAVQCNGQTCGGRNWDVGMPKPAFVTLSSGEWSTFTAEMQTLVSSYWRNGRAMYLLPVVILSTLIFNPGLGGRALNLPIGASMALLYAVVIFGLFAVFGGSHWMRKQNMEIDKQISDLCARTSGADFTISYQTMFTQPCKPKGVATYRALVIAPTAQQPVVAGLAQSVAGPVAAATPMLIVTCPPNAKDGDSVQIQGPSGQMLTVVVPPGVSPGQQFQVSVPAAPPVVAAVAVPVGVP